VQIDQLNYIKSKLRFLILAVFILTSCSDSYKILNADSFNNKIAGRTDIKTPEDLITLYYGFSSQNISVTSRELATDYYQITLIHEFKGNSEGDDSVAGEKIVMTAKRIGQKWTICEIKEAWKCWSGRGHTGWGNTPCN
jgi:hypothetical protein